MDEQNRYSDPTRGTILRAEYRSTLTRRPVTVEIVQYADRRALKVRMRGEGAAGHIVCWRGQQLQFVRWKDAREFAEDWARRAGLARELAWHEILSEWAPAAPAAAPATVGA